MGDRPLSLLPHQMVFPVFFPKKIKLFFAICFYTFTLCRNKCGVDFRRNLISRLFPSILQPPKPDLYGHELTEKESTFLLVKWLDFRAPRLGKMRSAYAQLLHYASGGYVITNNYTPGVKRGGKCVSTHLLFFVWKGGRLFPFLLFLLMEPDMFWMGVFSPRHVFWGLHQKGFAFIRRQKKGRWCARLYSTEKADKEMFSLPAETDERARAACRCRFSHGGKMPRMP